VTCMPQSYVFVDRLLVRLRACCQNCSLEE
jgi:hypothetical protein